MNNYYYQKYLDYNPGYLQLLNEAETAAERKSVKQRWIEDVKKQEYPKGQTKEIIAYIKSL